MEVSSIGTNARTATVGDCSATAPTTNTSVAAMLLAGATEGGALIVGGTRPKAPAFRPLSTCCSADWAIDSATAMGSPLHFFLPDECWRSSSNEVGGPATMGAWPARAGGRDHTVLAQS